MGKKSKRPKIEPEDLPQEVPVPNDEIQDPAQVQQVQEQVPLQVPEQPPMQQTMHDHLQPPPELQQAGLQPDELVQHDPLMTHILNAPHHQIDLAHLPPSLQAAAMGQVGHQAAELMAAQQAAEPTEPPKKRSRRPKSKKLGDDTPGHVRDVSGDLIPIPAKHGTPIKHSRPKRTAVQRKSLLGEEEPNMLMRIHLRRFEGDAEAEADQLPSATVHAHPSMSLEALRQKIHSFCPSLPAKAQQFFRKVEGDQFQRVDSSSRYNKSLKAVGFDEPGPHDIWIEIDLAELFKPQSPAPGTDGLQAQDGGVGPSQSQGLLTLQEGGFQGDVDSGTGFGEDGQIDRAQGSMLPEPAPMHHRALNKRSNKKWTEEEVENLLLGLMKFGTSSWTTIAKTWKFDDRTTVDLKDKWRNLVKNVRDGRVMRGMVLSEAAKAKVWRIIHENGIEATPQNQRGLVTEVMEPNVHDLVNNAALVNQGDGLQNVQMPELLQQEQLQNQELQQDPNLQQNLSDPGMNPGADLQGHQQQPEGLQIS